MKANELRIGNLTYRIEVKNKNNTVIDDITIYDIERIQEVHDKTFTYEPIPLTGEWLQKFGFQTEQSFVYELDDITINTSRGLMCIFTKCKNNVEIEITEYVHQLQNLYFALTNKELEYNNKI
jgi:hypothetical protein